MKFAVGLQPKLWVLARTRLFITARKYRAIIQRVPQYVLKLTRLGMKVNSGPIIAGLYSETKLRYESGLLRKTASDVRATLRESYSLRHLATVSDGLKHYSGQDYRSTNIHTPSSLLNNSSN